MKEIELEKLKKDIETIALNYIKEKDFINNYQNLGKTWKDEFLGFYDS